MNIAFDSIAILASMSKDRGIGNYVLAQFREMISRDKDNSYFFFNIFEPFSLGDYPNLKEEYFDCGKGFGMLHAADAAVYGSLIMSFIQKNKIDLFYITSPFDSSPFDGSTPTYRKEWFDGVKTVATVYDIIPYVFKERYLFNIESAFDIYMQKVDTLRWMDKLLVISPSVKQDLVEYLSFNSDKIEVIWGAPGSMFKPIDIAPDTAAGIRSKFNINGKFIMCTGGDDERKNIAGLIEAYGKLPKQLINEYALVIVCKLQPATEKHYGDLANQYGVGRNVVFTNFVSDEELLQLYNLSTLVAFPSKYEGFGLPVVEAWACHKPVLTSDNSSLSQIAGDAATLVNADDTDDIARGLASALRADNLSIMTEKGFKRQEMFRWSVVADKVIKEINLMKPEASANADIKARLACFTPLPPMESGVSDYSVDVLNALSKYFEIDVFIDDGYAPSCDLNAGIYNHIEYPQRALDYDYTLFQMGNSMFHYYMYPYLQEYGGILVLHDYNMHTVGHWISAGILKDGLETYRKYLLEDYSFKFVHSYFEQINNGGSIDNSLEMNGFVVNYADKIIVHSEYARNKLLERNVGRHVAKIPLYADIKPSDYIGAREKLGISTDSIVIGTFGHINEYKRAIPLLKAGVQMMRHDSRVRMFYVGKLNPSIEDEFHTICRQYDMADRVTVTGYVSLDEFNTYMDATDICFNLRYPHNGENSGSLSRVMAKGKCVVVNDIGSFGEFPDDCCVKLPSVESMSAQQEQKLIYQTMKRLANNDALRKRYADNAYAYAKEYLDINNVAAQYAAFIMSKHTVGISEQTLDDIRMQEIVGKQYTQRETRAVAKTLSYCVE